MKDIIVRKMCINDFNQVHKLVEQVHKLHLSREYELKMFEFYSFCLAQIEDLN